MSDQTYSEIVEIAKRNGNFRQNYGTIIGAFLYLRSVSAVRGRSVFWNGLIFTVITAALAWFEKYGWPCFGS
jgi:hypothetical protein